jgi:hypothetical protein
LPLKFMASKYMPEYTRIVSPLLEASIACWIELKSAFPKSSTVQVVAKLLVGKHNDNDSIEILFIQLFLHETLFKSTK